MTILTISSQVLYGHVGNSVADFTLKRLGHPVIAVPTVVLSNHKGYSDAVGEIFGPDLLRDFFSALERRGALETISAVQTGFMATVGQAQNIFDFLAELRSSKPDLPIIIDPVMGDKGRLYVDPALVTVFRERAPSLASLITPNVFEAQTLIDRAEAQIDSLAGGLEQSGFQNGLITSAETLLPPSPNRAILGFEPSGHSIVHHEGLSFQREPNGVGDFVAALSAGLYGQGTLLDRTKRISRALVALLKVTQATGSAELALVEGQNQWVDALS
jgi:pyridoxine kinase